jgi:tetratricopeptide (TPR) repeat protein/tRNA A-37 threonylcarbamoyl transferase component Bud32
MTLAVEDTLEPGTELFDYRIIEAAGRGGWAYVYKAQHLSLPMLVAIKQLKPELTADTEALQRFLREAQIIARLNHPNVVHIHNLKQDPDTQLHYIITEFAEKGTLVDLLEKHPQGLPIEQVIHIAAHICNGLEAAHRRGIVHRDIKPSNVLLFDMGEDQDVAKVCDFGIARSLEIPDAFYAPDLSVEMPRTSGVIGTFYYMSPEQLDEDMEVDHRSDLYSLGVLLYELLVGHVPFTGKILDVIWAHAYILPKSLRETRPEIPPSLEQIVLRALNKKPEDRYPSAAEMHRALNELWDVAAVELVEQGETYLEEGKWDLAIGVLTQADTFDPGNPLVQAELEEARGRVRLEELYQRALHCMEEEEWAKARECLAEVMAGDPNYAEGQAREQLEQATRALNQQRDRQELLVRYNTGMGFSRNGQWKLARECFEWVVNHDPAFQDAAARLAEVRRCLEAEDLYRQALEHEKREAWEEAVTTLERIIELNPPHIDVHQQLEEARRRRDQALGRQLLADLYEVGISHLEAGDLDKAADHLRRVYERQHDYSDVAERLAEIERRLGVEQRFARASELEAAREWAQAASLYQEILDVDPGHPGARRRLKRAQRRVKGGAGPKPDQATARVSLPKGVWIDLLGGVLGTLVVGGTLNAVIAFPSTAHRVWLAVFLFMIFVPLTHFIQQFITQRQQKLKPDRGGKR